MALAAAAVLVLAGCGSESASEPAGTPVPYGTHHVDKSLGMPAAEVRGTLKPADGCLMVELEGNEYPLVLPDVAVWDEQAQEVTIEGRTYAMGDEVSWGGAYGPRGDVPETCPLDAETAVVFDAS